MKARITIRMPNHCLEKITLAASMLGVTVNEFILEAALAKAEEVLAHEEITMKLFGMCKLLDGVPDEI